jgi:hypothetical protein
VARRREEPLGQGPRRRRSRGRRPRGSQRAGTRGIPRHPRGSASRSRRCGGLRRNIIAPTQPRLALE